MSISLTRPIRIKLYSSKLVSLHADERDKRTLDKFKHFVSPVYLLFYPGLFCSSCILSYFEIGSFHCVRSNPFPQDLQTERCILHRNTIHLANRNHDNRSSYTVCLTSNPSFLFYSSFTCQNYFTRIILLLSKPVFIGLHSSICFLLF